MTSSVRAGYILEAGVIGEDIFANLTKSLQSGKGSHAFSSERKVRLVLKLQHVL
jgi:hypothetical protein